MESKYQNLVLLGLLLTGASTFAQGTPVVPDISPLDFLNMVTTALKGFGGLSWTLKVGAVINLAIGSMKVSFIRAYTWDKIPVAIKPLVAPTLALIAGACALQSCNVAALTAWALAGGGAILIDDLLAVVKTVPGIGKRYLTLIDLVSMFLKRPKTRK